MKRVLLGKWFIAFLLLISGVQLLLVVSTGGDFKVQKACDAPQARTSPPKPVVVRPRKESKAPETLPLPPARQEPYSPLPTTSNSTVANSTYRPAVDAPSTKLPPVFFDLKSFCHLNKQYVTQSGATAEANPAAQRFEAVPGGSRSVRVRFLVFHPNSVPAERLFYTVVSARLAGVPVETVTVAETPLRKLDLVAQYMEAEGLGDDDVVMALESGALFAGIDIFPVMQDFIANSAPSRDAMNGWKTRHHVQFPPVLFAATERCLGAPEIPSGLCHKPYTAAYSRQQKLSVALNESVQSSMGNALNPNRYVASAMFTGRVWALKMMYRAAKVFESFFMPISGGEWRHEQGVYATLFTKLLYTEAERRLLWRNGSAVEVEPFGLLVGMLGVDHGSHFAMDISSVGDVQRFMYGEKALTSSFLHFGVDSKTVDMVKNESAPNYTAAGARLGSLQLHYVSNKWEWGSRTTLAIPVDPGKPAPIWFVGSDFQQYVSFLRILPTAIAVTAFPEAHATSMNAFLAMPPNKAWVAQRSGPDRVQISRAQENDYMPESLCSMIEAPF